MGAPIARRGQERLEGQPVERWTAAGMEVAALNFRRVKGYRGLPILVENLKAEVAIVTGTSHKIGFQHRKWLVTATQFQRRTVHTLPDGSPEFFLSRMGGALTSG